MGSEASLWDSWGADLMALSVTILVLVLIGMFIWQVFRTYQTRLLVSANAAQEAAYRTLAEQGARAQEHTGEQLALLQDNLAELNRRVAAIERVLKDVE